MNKKKKTVLWIVLLVLVVAGGIVTGVLLHNKQNKNEKPTETETTVKQEDTTETQTEETTETTAEETTEAIEEAVDYASVYLSILQREQDKILYYNQFRSAIGDDWSGDYEESAPIAIADITGDGVPELLLIQSQSMDNNYVADLYVYTVENGVEKQIIYENGWDVQVAGGSTYALFQIEGEPTLYASNGMSDEFTEENYYRYDVLANGNISKTELMTRYNQPNEDYTQTISTCTINGADATAEAFQTELDGLSGKVTTLLLYNHDPFDDRASEKLAQAEQMYMTYDEAVAYLSDLQGDSGAVEQTQPEGQTAGALPFDSAKDFYFASGVGGWGTSLTLNPDGTFTGCYHDSNLGDSGDGYDCTVYICNFNGSFQNIREKDEYTYSMELASVEIDDTESAEWIEEQDGTRVRYILAEPYGIDGGKTFYLYLPGTPVSVLPAEYVGWCYGLSEQTELPGYGLYNVDMQEGFSE